MAHAEFFGDSFQYCHRVLLRAIAPPDEWIVHPMLFRYEGGGLNPVDYAQFLGLPNTAVLSRETIGRRLTRQTMVGDVEPYANFYLFLDPDTGIAIQGGGDTSHVTAQQVADIAGTRNGQIVLIHEQGYEYEAGQPRDRVAQKLQCLWVDHQLHSAAIIVRTSPLVSYVWVSTEHYPVDVVMDSILHELPIPERLLVPCPY